MQQGGIPIGQHDHLSVRAYRTETVEWVLVRPDDADHDSQTIPGIELDPDGMLRWQPGGTAASKTAGLPKMRVLEFNARL